MQYFAPIKNFFLGLFSRDTVAVVAAVIIFTALQLLLIFPQQWWLWIIVAISLTIVSGILLTNFETPVPGWWHTLISPILLVTTSASLILFFDTAVSRQLVIIAATALLALFWENIRRYYWDLKNYHAESLENVSLGINIFIVWFTASTLYHLLLDPSIVQKFSNVIIPVASILMVLVIFMVDYRTIWVQRYSAKKVWLLLVAQAMIVSELFWVLNFLPHSIEVKSFMVALVYYYFVSIGRVHLDGNLNSVVMRRYIYFGTGFLILVLITSRWLI